jgi:flagellar hook-associated protein 1 FlgK
MSLTSALSIALSGLQVASARLQVASNNIANAGDTGYTEKTANVGAVSNGSQAGGAIITGFSRVTNTGLTASYNSATSESSFLNTQNNYLKQVQTILDSTSNNPALSDAVSQFQSAWTQFSAAPESSAQQQAVIQAGTTLASQINTASSGVLALSRQVTNDTTATVTSLNSDLSQIAAINQQIATAGPDSSSTGNLQDTRDTLINSVASITNVQIMQRANGQIALYTPQGVPLVDGAPQVFTYNGNTVTSASGQDVTNSLTGGSLQAELNFAYNGSPAAASTAPGSEVIRKLNSQLVALTNAFTGTTGSPASFASAYNGATTNTGELASGFFTVTLDGSGNPEPSSLAVNASLLNGTASVKAASGPAVVTALAATRSFTADGLSASGTYSDLSTAILSNFQQAANTLSTQSATATSQQSYYQQSLSNATGVNVDNELVQLTTLQNSYAASAHVISTVNQMFQTLTAILP